MICPKCGEDLGEGFSYCVACGIDAKDSNGEDEKKYDVNASLFGGAGSSYNSLSVSTPKKKSGASGIIVGVVVIAFLALVVCYFLGIRYWGTYKLESVEYDGVTRDWSEIVALAGDAYDIDFSIKLKPGKAEINVGVPGTSKITGKYDVKYKGSKIIFKDDSYDIEAEYDSSEKTIKLQSDGVYLVFKKQ